MNALKNSLRTLVALITLLVCLSSIQGFSEDFVGCYNTGAEFADMKISKSLTGKYTVHFRQSAEGEWQAIEGEAIPSL